LPETGETWQKILQPRQKRPLIDADRSPMDIHRALPNPFGSRYGMNHFTIGMNRPRDRRQSFGD
jgi:hypothetical protein